MRWTLIAAAVVTAIGGAATSVSAVWIDSTVHYIERGHRRNAVWPWPHVCPDRIAVREPFKIMVDNGWRRQNMLGSHHFDPATNRLTTSGELQVRWIMTQAPQERRQVFVERALDPAVTAERLAVARAFATQIALDGRTPEVYETHLVAEGRPAATVDMTNVRFMEFMPPPVLPAASPAGGTD